MANSLQSGAQTGGDALYNELSDASADAYNETTKNIDDTANNISESISEGTAEAG